MNTLGEKLPAQQPVKQRPYLRHTANPRRIPSDGLFPAVGLPQAASFCAWSTHIPSSRSQIAMPGCLGTDRQSQPSPAPLLTPVPAAQSTPEQRGDVSVLDLEAFLSYRLLNMSRILNFKQNCEVAVIQLEFHFILQII